MRKLAPAELVSVVIKEKMKCASDSQITDTLVKSGVPLSHASEALEIITIGYKSGTVAAVTGGLSAKKLPLGQNELFDAAFRRGRHDVRWASIPWRLYLGLTFFILGVIVVIWLAHR